MEQFLSLEFQQGAVRRLAKSMDAAASAVHATLLNRVAPAAEAAVLRLSELQALARWRERVGPVGLTEAAADAALAAAERACLAAGVAIRVSTAAAARLRAFFVLLLRTQRVLAGENPDGEGAAGDEQNWLPAANPTLVREFLEDGIRVDRLGEQLSAGAGHGAGVGGWARASFADDGDDRGVGGRVAAAREEFLAAVRGAAAAAGFGASAEDDGGGDAGGRHPGIAGSGKLPLLWSAAGELKGACLTALDAPAAAVSSSFEWGASFPVVSAGTDSRGTRGAVAPRVSHGGWSEAGCQSNPSLNSCSRVTLFVYSLRGACFSRSRTHVVLHTVG